MMVAALAGCSSNDTEEMETLDESDDTEVEETDFSDNSGGGDDSPDFSVDWNLRRYDKLTTPDNENVYYESTAEEQYVGVQVRVTNEIDDELTLGDHELSVVANGTTDEVSIHAQSRTDPFESITAGETVETWLIYIVPPDAELDFQPTDFAEHTFELNHDDELEIALEEYEDSG